MYKRYLSYKIVAHLKNGFTLAEIMVVLFVLTVILAAFAPIMTTRTKTTATSPVSYASPDTANAYFGIHDNQRFMLGQNTKDSDIANKLTINTPDTTTAAILFKNDGTASAQLNATSAAIGTLILGGNPESAYTGGSYNTAVGLQALSALTTGYSNVAIGYKALSALTTGYYNVGIGYNACSSVTTAGYRTCIGANSGPNSGTSNYLYLGNNNTTVYIGSTSLASYITTAASDERLKNIKGENTAGIEKIKQMKTYDYTLKADKENVPYVGVIAQEVQKFFPEAVFKGNDGYLKIRKDVLFFAAVNAIKELAAQANDKDLKIQELEKKNAELEERLLRLEEKMEVLSAAKVKIKKKK